MSVVGLVIPICFPEAFSAPASASAATSASLEEIFLLDMTSRERVGSRAGPRSSATIGGTISPHLWRRWRYQGSDWYRELILGGVGGYYGGVGVAGDDISLGTSLMISNKNNKCITKK